MSAETTFRALLAAHAPLVALVGTAIAQNVAPQGALPLVVFAAQHNRSLGLDGTTLLADEVTFSVQCVGNDALQADAVADAVSNAISSRAVVTGREGAFNEELQLDITVMQIQWFDV